MKKNNQRTIFSEDVLDDVATSSPLRSVPAGLKLFLCLAATVIAVASPEIWAPLFVGITMIFASLALAKVPFRLYLSLLTIPLAFGLSGAVILLFFTGGGEILVSFFSFWVYDIQITTDSLHLSLLVFARTLGGMCSLYFLAVTTPMTSLFAVFQKLHIPQEFIDLTMLIYRYIFVFIGEAIGIHNAQVIRGGYQGWKNGIYAFSMLVSMLFVRTWERGDEIFLSMNSRCYDGCMALPEESSTVQVKSYIAVFSYLGILVLLFAAEMIL